MQHLVFAAEVSVVEGITPRQKGCAVNQGNATLGLVLNDTTAQPAQTLFYQVQLDQLCGIQTAARSYLCHAVRADPLFFFGTNPYGAGDALPVFGPAFLRSGEVRPLHFDLLPRLRRVLASRRRVPRPTAGAGW
jgi:hypothetical protein